MLRRTYAPEADATKCAVRLFWCDICHNFSLAGWSSIAWWRGWGRSLPLAMSTISKDTTTSVCTLLSRERAHLGGDRPDRVQSVDSSNQDLFLAGDSPNHAPAPSRSDRSVQGLHRSSPGRHHERGDRPSSLHTTDTRK